MKRGASSIRLFAALTATVAICTSATQALALDPQKTMTQFKHRSWGAAEGFDRVAKIAQTQDGYIWIGAAGGLYRFDGVAFAHWKQPGVTDQEPWAMIGAADGSLWVSWGSYVVQIKNGGYRLLATKDGSQLTNVQEIYEASDGAIWFAGEHLARFGDGQLEVFGPESGLPEMLAFAVTEDHQGTIWVSLIDKPRPNYTYGLFAFRPRGESRFQLCPQRHLGVPKLRAQDNGKIWIAETQRSVRAFTNSGTEIQFLVPEILGGSMDILFDRDGALWMTTLGDGVFRIRDPAALGTNNVDHLSPRRDTYSQIHGLSGDFVTCIFEDREGNIWIGTSAGVDCFTENKITSFTAREGLPFAQDLLVERGPDERIWAGNRSQGFMRLTGDREWTTAQAGAFGAVYSLFTTPQGQLLAGTARGVAMLHTNAAIEFQQPDLDLQLRDVRAMTVDKEGGLWLCDSVKGTFRILGNKADRVTQVREASIVAHCDDAGRVWFGHIYGGLGLYESGHYKRYPAGTNGILPGQIRAILSEPAGKVWFAGAGGISFFDGENFKKLDRSNGLPGEDLAAVLKDDDGFYWFAGMDVIFSVTRENLQKALSSGGPLVCAQALNFADGLRGFIRPNLDLAHPVAAKGPDGRLWFSAGNGLAMVNSRAIPKNRTPPPVHIGRVMAGGRTYEKLDSLDLPMGTRSCQIDYVGLSFSDPARVRYRYKLEGYDEGWVDAGPNRQAIYSNLKPKKYNFQVIACNDDGVWNEQGDSIEFAIRPAFYETAWFPPLCALPAALAVWGLYRLRLARVTARMKQQLEGQIKERKRIAQELHDTLLQGFTGIGLKLDAITGKLPESLGETKQQLRKILDQSDQYLTEARRSVWELRATSLEKTDDFPKVLSEAGERILEGTGIHLVSSVHGNPQKLPSAVEDNLLRICEEAVANAVKHARPTEVRLNLEYGAGKLTLRIKDNGRGFDPQSSDATKSGHFGLVGLQERARAMGGSVALSSQPGEGTEITASVNTI